MNVRVDHSGRHNESLTVDHVRSLVAGSEVTRLPDGDNAVAFDGDARIRNDMSPLVHRHDQRVVDQRVSVVERHA